MKDATLAQGNQIVNLILQKKVSCEKLQELIASGMLSDLLEAEVGKVDRLKFREALGLSCFKHDKTKNGWKLLEDVEFSGVFTPDIKEFLKPGESSVNGEEMKKRAKKLNAHLGQKHAEYLLDHQELIPKEWRGNYLVFPGTVWQDRGGDRYVPCLYWNGDRWYLDFYWLEDDGWSDDDRLVCLHPSTTA